MNGTEAAIVIIVGAVGGLIGAITSGLLENPGWVTLDDGRRGLRLGWLGNMFVGGAASFTFWALGLASSTEPQVYGIALISGFGGARILDSLLEAQIARFEREQLVDVAVKATEALEARAPDKDKENDAPENAARIESKVADR